MIERKSSVCPSTFSATLTGTANGLTLALRADAEAFQACGVRVAHQTDVLLHHVLHRRRSRCGTEPG
jgi:hypothetical protein